MKSRCSSLGREIKCPASTIHPRVKIDRPESTTMTGNAGHFVAYEIVKKNIDGIPELGPIALKYDADVDDLRWVAWAVREAWDFLKESIKMIEVETKLTSKFGDLTLSGHPDFLGSDSEGNLVIIDWKTGFADDDATDQLMGYLTLGLEKFPEFKGGKIITVYCRTKKMDTKVILKSDIGWWLEKVFLAHDNVETFNPGPHCKYCPRKYECEAKGEMLNQFGLEIMGNQVLTTDDFGAFHDRVKLLKKAIASAEQFIKDEVHAQGEIPLSDGRKMSMTQIITEKIDLEKGWELLKKSFSEEQMMTFLTISKTKMQKIIRDRSLRGQKQPAVDQFMSELKSEEAIVTGAYDKLTLSKGVPRVN